MILGALRQNIPMRKKQVWRYKHHLDDNLSLPVFQEKLRYLEKVPLGPLVYKRSFPSTSVFEGNEESRTIRPKSRVSCSHKDHVWTPERTEITHAQSRWPYQDKRYDQRRYLSYKKNSHIKIIHGRLPVNPHGLSRLVSTQPPAFFHNLQNFRRISE